MRGIYWDFRFLSMFTSTWLGRVLTNLNPGILLSLHTTPTSSVCLQSDTPIPLEGHRAKVRSLPLQWRLSNQMGPEPDKREIHQFFPWEEFFPFSSGNNKRKKKRFLINVKLVSLKAETHFYHEPVFCQ